MNIKYAILGFLSWHPFTGYELKKMFMDSPYFYWSGNNNQIYRTLVLLLNEGLATKEVQYQENYPARKLYSITEDGKSELRRWIISAPELPQIRNSFLSQLAWADQLQSEELHNLLNEYEHEIEMQLVMRQEKERRGNDEPARSVREKLIWKLIADNWIESYKSELKWIKRLGKELGNL